MISNEVCSVSAEFDTGSFMYFSVSGPTDDKGYGTNIQDKYNLSFEDFFVLEYLMNKTITEYLEKKNDNTN